MCDTKKCSKCGEVKGLDGFAKRSCNPDGLDNKCRACKSAYVKQLKQANPEFAQKERNRTSRYRQENAENIAAQRAKYHAENKQMRNAASRLWKLQNGERNTLMQRIYKSVHRHEAREYSRQWYWQHRTIALAQDAAARRDLHEAYVRVTLGLRKADTTPSLIALKREQLAIKRMARELKKAATKPTGENE